MVRVRLDSWLLYTLAYAAIFLKVEGSDGIGLTIIKSAVAKGAVCLDGSPPAYQFDEGFGEGVNNWLVNVQGGGYCVSVKDCLLRINNSNGYGSSNLMKSMNFTGILSNKQEHNPNFYNWNRVFVRYCDGAMFTGDVQEIDPATNLHFRGARIFKVVIEELLAKGMKNASNALLSGCSAGGYATIIHCDSFRAFFPTSTRVKCAPDAAYVSRVKDLSGNYHFEKILNQILRLHGSAKILPQACISKRKPGRLCIYPEFLMPYIKTPVFVLNSAYDTFQIENVLALEEADPHGSFSKCKKDLHKCSTSQLKRLKVFRSDFLDTLAPVANRSSNGMFINTCYIHCQSDLQTTWFGNPSSKLDNTAIADALGDWFYDRRVFQKIDNKHVWPHNCTC